MPNGGAIHIRLRISSQSFGASDANTDLVGGETEDYVYFIPVTLKGAIYNDGNGIYGTPPKTVDGLKISTVEGNPLYIIKYDYISETEIPYAVNPDGTYEITLTQEEDVDLYVSIDNNNVLVLPNNWFFSSEQFDIANVLRDNPNGVISLGTVNRDLENNDFGINKIPTSINVHKTLPQPNVNDTIVLFKGSTPPLSGVDNEDGTFINLTGSINNPYQLMITKIPANGELYYRGILRNDTFEITNLSTDSVFFVFTGAGYSEYELEYIYFDQAHMAGELNSYLLDWAYPLPIELNYFQLTTFNDYFQLNWETNNQDNLIGFEIQRSHDATNWETLSFVNNNNNNNQNFKTSYEWNDYTPLDGKNYYRLLINEQDETISLSNILLGISKRKTTYTISPNPSFDYLTINGIHSEQDIIIKDLNNKIILRTRYIPNNKINISNLSAGQYNIFITDTTPASTKHIGKFIKL